MIGMPGCGKSTVGVVLAKAIGKEFLDTDLLIQEQEGRLLQQIIDQKGNEYFQTVEEEILAQLQKKNCVISTGGSAVYYPRAMENLRKQGATVYIRLSLETIITRLDNIKTRGITMANGETVDGLYRARIPLYERYADITIDGEKKDVEQIVEEIILSFKIALPQ